MELEGWLLCLHHIFWNFSKYPGFKLKMLGKFPLIDNKEFHEQNCPKNSVWSEIE
jgi:hypothetical protein